jgi:DNA-binding CsgD family transcriptional regulator
LPAAGGNSPLTIGSTFVGRENEMAQLSSLIESGEPRAMIIAGRAGVGKTRLAAEALTFARASGYSTGHVVGSRSAVGIPFGAFAPLLSETGGVGGDLTSFLVRARDAVVERVGPGPRRLLVVDDAQELDENSAALLLQLAMARVCSLLVTLRTPSTPPEAVTVLWKDGYADRIDLGLLTEAEVDEFVAGALGAPLVGNDVHWLWKESNGNALYVKELLVAAAAEGVLETDRGVFVMRRRVETGTRLTELVSARLSNLPASILGVLDVVALSEPVGAAIVEAIAGAQALEDAQGLGLLAVSKHDRRSSVSLAHPIYASVIREGMTLRRRRSLSEQLGRALEATGARRHDDTLRMAKLHLDAGVASDPELLTKAARMARHRFDTGLAADLARAAVEAGGGLEAGLVLAETLILFPQRKNEEAERVLVGLMPMCTNDTEIAMVANARSFNFSAMLNDKEAGIRVAEEALAKVTDENARLRLQGRLATTSLLAGDLAAAIDRSEPLVSCGVDSLAYRGIFAASYALALRGDTDEAVALAYRGVEIHRGSSEQAQIPEIQLHGAVLGHLGAGRLDDAERDARRGYEACLEANDTEGAAPFAMYRGWIGVTRGALGDALRMFREASGAERELNDRKWALGGVALAAGMAGQADEAAAAVRDLDALEQTWVEMLELELAERGRAWALVAAGELSRGTAAMKDAAARARTTEHRVAEAFLLHDLARLGEARFVAARLGELAPLVRGELVGTLAAHAEALVDGSGAALEDAGERLERLGTLLLAAEAYGAAAVAFTSEGLSRRSNGAARKSSELMSICGNPRSAVSPVGTSVAGLTRRQREIAELAARGASDKEIAERLYLSVRTVETHLAKTYLKLGISGRDGLADALGSPRPEG